MWVNEGQERVRVGECGGGGCTCGKMRGRRVCVWVKRDRRVYVHG